jgi:hypothetical protein
MLRSYYQNADVAMTKDAYFELCEMLGTEPQDEDIPVETSDLPPLVQTSLAVYSYLPDRWEGMSGTYMGKDLNILFNLLDIFKVEKDEYRLVLELISTIDSIRSNLYKEKKPKEPSKS